jgi:adenylate cyclase
MEAFYTRMMIRIPRSQVLAAVGAALVVFAGVMGMRELAWLQGLELSVYDQFVRRATPVPASPSRVTLLEITERDIREQGHWPLSDGTLALALQKLVEQEPRVVGLDIYRDLPVPPGEAQLSRLLEREPRIIAVSMFGNFAEDSIPGPPVLEDSGRVGFNDLLLDPDHTVRRGLLFLDSDDSDVGYAFALRIALLAIASEGVVPRADPSRPEWLRLGPNTLRPLESNDGGYVRTDARGYQFMLDFARAVQGFDTISLGELLRGEVGPERLRDRIVLVGVNAESLPDFFPVPFRSPGDVGVGIPGVELHGHIVDQIVRTGLGESTPLRVVSDGTEAFVILLMALLGCSVGWSARWRPAYGVSVMMGAVLLGLGALWLVGAAAYRAGIWLPVVAPGVAWVSAVGVVNAWRSSREHAQREQMMSLFSRYVSREIADEIWRQRADFFHDGRPRPQRITATILFIDIKGYSVRAEKMDPEILLAWINDFMGSMAPIVGRSGGVVDDYFGDGMMAVFGVPFARTAESEIDEDARRAVRCAVEMAATLERLNADYRERDLPTVQLRIGINTGPVVAGSLGSADRLKYTVMGDAVVVSKRIESLAPLENDYEGSSCRILISDRTEQRLDESVRREPLGAFALKGKHEEVSIYRVLP